MATISEQIENIRKEIRETPYHKGTEHYIGMLRARIARLKDKEIESQTKSGGGGVGYAVRKQGDATLVLVGPPSVGKSTLINKLTNAKSKVAPYAFTTVSVIPGMMEYNNARIQILDVPGLIEGAEEGKGRGREVLSVARGADLIILITDTRRIDAIDRIAKALHKNGVRLNETKPDVIVKKKLSGGIIVHSNLKQEFSKETVKEVASELGIKNADITIKEKLSLDRLIDTFSKNRVYTKSINVVNKIDMENVNIEKDFVYISAEKNINIDLLLEEIWNKLGLITIYLVNKDEEPNENNPMVIKKGHNINDIGKQISDEFLSDKKQCQIWGTGAVFPGQIVPLSTKPNDGMQIRFI